MAQDIIVPYNFIPLSSWVFTPDWSEHTYHDIPFSDGISGKINYKIVNSTPICVGHKSNDKHIIWERSPSGEFVIPGSSVKGLLRTAMEIVSYGRMNTFFDKKHSRRLGIEEVMGQGSEYKRLPILVRPDKGGDGSWQYMVTNTNENFKPMCGSVGVKILEKLNVTANDSAITKIKALLNLFNKENGDKCEYMPVVYAHMENKSGYTKKQMLKNTGDRKKTEWLEVEDFSLTKDDFYNTPGMFLFMDKNISNDNKGDTQKVNKYTDYFFYFNDGSLENDNLWLNFGEEGSRIIADLKKSLPPVKADDNGQKDDNLFDYYRKYMHPKAGFPVWYLYNEQKESDSCLGFCQVMRKSCRKSVGELVSMQQKYPREQKHDLSDTIFGYIVSGKEGESSSGRVGFSDLFCKSGAKIISKNYVLGEPKSSFFPAYLGRFSAKKPYDDNESLIAGRKLYKVRNKIAESNLSNDNENIRSKVDLVDTGSEFTGTITFHNLKPEELGALLWVMTFGEGVADNSCYYHTLGHAKPMGAGAVQFKLNRNSIEIPEYMTDGSNVLIGDERISKDDLIEKCINRFKQLMNLNYPFGRKDHFNEWENSKIMQLYLKYSKVDTDFDENKVYNHFPAKKDDQGKKDINEFNLINKKYRSSGKNSSDCVEIDKYESNNYDLSIADKRKEFFKQRQDEEAKKKQDEENRKLLEANRDEQLKSSYAKLKAIDNSENAPEEFIKTVVNILVIEKALKKTDSVLKQGFDDVSNFNQLAKNFIVKHQLSDQTIEDVVQCINNSNDKDFIKSIKDVCKKRKDKDAFKNLEKIMKKL